jgi:hypothetical protein
MLGFGLAKKAVVTIGICAALYYTGVAGWTWDQVGGSVRERAAEEISRVVRGEQPTTTNPAGLENTLKDAPRIEEKDSGGNSLGYIVTFGIGAAAGAYVSRYRVVRR